MLSILSFLVACIVLGFVWIRTLKRNYFTAGLTLVLFMLIIGLLYSAVIVLIPD